MTDPTCSTHNINHGTDQPCPDCEDNAHSYRGMQTPLVNVGNLYQPRYDGRTPATEGETLPARSTHVSQK